MNKEYDWDVYEIFKDQIFSQISLIQKDILLLKDKNLRKDSIDQLFRYFHTYKSSSSYLSLTPLNQLVSKTEVVLSLLREKETLLNSTIIDWLQEVVKQLNIYMQELEDNQTELSTLPSYFSKKIPMKISHIDLKNRLKTLSILYMDADQKRAQKIVPFLQKMVKKVQHSRENSRQNTIFNLQPFDIILINLNKENFQVIDFIQGSYPDISIIPIFEKINSISLNKLKKRSINHYIQMPLSREILYRELISITKKDFTPSPTAFGCKKIDDFIENLQPLSNTIIKVVEICDNEESSLLELIKVVKSDPLLATQILHMANTPIYSSLQLTTIDQAVVKFGKKNIKAITLGGLYNSLGKIDLSPYNINENIFSKIAISKLFLMIKWYSKVSIADLSLLSSTAILSNIGQILIVKELIESDSTPLFKELSELFDFRYTEYLLLNTTTSYVSAQIIRYLNLSAD